MAINKRELERLPPEQRLRKLRELEEERKKEGDEIEKLIRDSMKELRTDKLAEEITPERRPVDISRLFETGAGLERTAREEMPAVAFTKGTKAYQAFVQTYQAYSELKAMYGSVSVGMGLTEEQLKAIGQIGERLNIAEKYMTEGEKAASKLDASRAVLYKLKKETGIE